MSFDWSKMGRTPPAALVEARNLAHHAAQWLTKAARGNLKPVADDSHSSLVWDASLAALLSQPLPAKDGEVRVGLRIARFELIVVASGGNVLDSFQLDGKTDAASGAWIDSKMRALGLKPASGVALPYSLPDHPAGGKPLELGTLGRELGDLSRWFAGPADALEEFRGKLHGLHPEPLLCWPHHFDIATLVTLGVGKGSSAQTIGVGASPGDEFYAQPYFYVSPSPRLDGALPELPRPGRWHTEGFFGAVATGEELLALKDRGPGLLAFLAGAFEICRARLGA